ncbi:hypothetical protein QTP88_012887 [Uroleucon formosanum]
MTEAKLHILIPDTTDKINQESYSNVKQNELSLTVNEKLLSVALENEIITDMSLSKSSEFNDSEIPTVLSDCRICLQSDFDKTNKYISPCFCRGSMSMVHRACLEKWLLQSGSSVCEICAFQYKTKRVSKYSLLGSIKAWVFSSENKEEVKEFFYDGCVLLIILPFLSLFSYVGFSRMKYINTDIQIKCHMTYRVVSFIACWTMWCADFFFCFWKGRVQHHILNWYNFYKNNQSIVLEPEPQNSSKSISWKRRSIEIKFIVMLVFTFNRIIECILKLLLLMDNSKVYDIFVLLQHFLNTVNQKLCVYHTDAEYGISHTYFMRFSAFSRRNVFCEASLHSITLVLNLFDADFFLTVKLCVTRTWRWSKAGIVCLPIDAGRIT